MTSVQRRNLGIVVGAGVACVIVILWMFLRPHYVTVFTGLDDKSMGQVETQLQTLKIPSRMTGSSIEVPASQADTARVQLAMAGLPTSGYIGYSSVSNSMGMTQDQFNIQVLDALQQSLNETIQSINGIESAQVHIVMPTQQLFVSQPTDTAKASVFVQLGSGVVLSAAQVAGIQQLVAHSVTGLSLQSVTVIDQNGVDLSSSANSASLQGAAANELSVKQQLEQNLNSQLTQGLTRIVGPGNAVVMVHANVTFNRVQSNSHVVQPAAGQSTGLPSSSSVTRSSSNSTGSAPGGIPGQSGTNPNLPTYGGTVGGGGSTTSSQSQANTTYDNSWTNTQTISDPMQIQGVTVGVFLNAMDPNLSASMVSQIQSFVANAVGLKTGTGANNNITVVKIPFSTGNTPTKSGILLSSAWLWAALAGVLLMTVGGVYWRRKRRTARLGMETVTALPPLEEFPVSPETQMREELGRLAQHRPEEFASLLRSWLSQD
ncbi:flagellar M-ring protein FliF [Alicyclobacillaceae bacterium I2511]|nr:flagellar M-ring protein FliF [Alicyclobacillaceae bacterium I2511]